MKTKAKYLELLMGMNLDWLIASVNNPSVYMKPIHIKLHWIAIRRKS